mgnify:CR=1 FL=1
MNNLNIKVNAHSSICINENIYIDPFEIDNVTKNAKYVFITHSHWDHLDLKSIKNITNNETIFICPNDCSVILLNAGFKRELIKVVYPNEFFEIGDIKCQTFNSYNTNKDFHPLSNNWLGYNLQINNIAYTICGDSDLTNELKQIRTDVLFVPIGGTYTMNSEEASILTNIINPKLVIPVHYGKIVGGLEPEKEFVSKINKNINYKILLKD